MLPLSFRFGNGFDMAFHGVVIGAGDLGLRLASLRLRAGDAVTALRRRQLPIPEGIRAVHGDIHDPSALALLPESPDWLVFCATPDTR